MRWECDTAWIQHGCGTIAARIRTLAARQQRGDARSHAGHALHKRQLATYNQPPITSSPPAHHQLTINLAHPVHRTLLHNGSLE
ncbi:unnamed protein product [Parnassius apollo]|uniref:(apollo) hypothetical protein n=1 Tax=Parnassius apollo TaxID=110799 RepID=A0A8S3Y603_PARAO|nr:unnamed protein product [Parnassius apollo]